MFNIIFNICQYIFPILGVIGFFTNNVIMMIASIIFSIFQSMLGYYTGQLKPGSAHILLFLILGLLISYLFKIEWYKGLTIIFSFGNAVILIVALIFIPLFSHKKPNNNV